MAWPICKKAYVENQVYVATVLSVKRMATVDSCG